MCGKMGVNEIDTLQNMMGMSICFALADILDVDAMALQADSRLTLDESQVQTLGAAIAEMFDSCELDFSGIHCVGDLIAEVLRQQGPLLH